MAYTYPIDNLEEFMEVVMSYRCKFCHFMAHSTQEMAHHVRSTHQRKPAHDRIKEQAVERSSMTSADTVQSYVYSSGILEGQTDDSSSIKIVDCVTVATDNGEAALDCTIEPTQQPTMTDMDVSDNNETGSPILPPHSVSVPYSQPEAIALANETGSQSRVIAMTNQGGSQSEVIELTNQTGLHSEVVTLTNQVGSQSEIIAMANQAGSQSEVVTSSNHTDLQSLELITNSTSETDEQAELLRLVSASEAGPVLNEASEMRGFQFVNSEGQYILQDGQNLQFDNGSTVQVLIHNAEFDSARGDNSGGMAKELAEHVVEETNETQAVETGENLHYIIEGEDLYKKVAEKEESADTDTAESQTEGDDKLPGEPKHDGYFVDGGNGAGETNQTEMELFLCGTCRQGFATIQDCKAHMTETHNPQDTIQSKVDAGTQMEPRKRAGRKKKSEILAAEAKEDSFEEPMALSDSDEDWSQKNEMYSHSKRSQRRRKPPESLRKDFYLGRTRKVTTKKHEDPGLNIRCPLKGCTGRFREDETLKKHMDCHIKGATSSEHQFKCFICEEKFFFWKLARYHLWKAHKVDMDLLTCPTCHVFKTDAMSKLKVHCEIHNSERPYVCDICGKAFKQVAQMKNHKALHSEVKLENERSGQTYKWHMPKTCDICERRFANAKCLKKHQEILHSQIKPFKCRFCEHECARKAMLILHERTHTGEKPFKCDLCNYSCGDHNSLRRHKMRHSGQRPYKCPHCPYSCIQAISLKVHIKNKHPGMGGIYNCSMCLYRTVNEQQYKNHLKDHKNGLIEKTVENADLQAAKTVTIKQRKSRSLLDRQEMMISLPQNVISNFQSQNVIMDSMSLPQIVQIPASAIQGMENSDQLEMQIQIKGQGNPDIGNEALSESPRVENYDGLVQSDMAAAQLIYSALSAISQNSEGENSRVVAGVENGDIQTSIETNSSQGVTTHTITFHLPESEELSGPQQAIVRKDSDGVTVIQVERDGVWEGQPAVDLENV